jgi:hypothetical protein
MQLYLFNNIKIKPYVILIVRVLDEQEYEYIQNNFTNIFEILIEDDIADIDDLLVFSLIKEFNKKIENFIQPFSKKNEDKRLKGASLSSFAAPCSQHVSNLIFFL